MTPAPQPLCGSALATEQCICTRPAGHDGYHSGPVGSEARVWREGWGITTGLPIKPNAEKLVDAAGGDVGGTESDPGMKVG